MLDTLLFTKGKTASFTHHIHLYLGIKKKQELEKERTTGTSFTNRIQDLEQKI